ncbi:HIT-like domain-containing protein [Mycena belliarum]|uniref:HIT-like domain-containing protein n=1 Tax=Mycena belliarum TaxID=1033014 RepID=A0AAD6UJN9_9AGAR|nr:HIT-like domain-containing protein [Mycena belliae]
MAANESSSCLFCAILQGKIPCHKVYETEHSFAFLDIMPVAEGHTQVIPKYHAETLGDLPDEYLRDIGPVIKKIALATGVEQYNVLQNNGKLAFQHVPHVHFHVIPKPSENEGLVMTMEQNWPMKKAENDALAATCEKMKGRL